MRTTMSVKLGEVGRVPNWIANNDWSPAKRLEWLPLVTAVVDAFTSSLMILVGFGVVVTTTLGSAPSRSPNMSMSQASG